MGDPAPLRNLVLAFPVPKGVLTEQQAAERDRRADRDGSREKRLENIRRSGIGKHLGPGDANILVRAQVSETPALRLVRSWAQPERESARRWLLVAGTTGVGKTVAAAWLLARDGGRYITMTDLVRLYSPILRGLAPTTQDQARARLYAIARSRTVALAELVHDRLSVVVARASLHWLFECRH